MTDISPRSYVHAELLFQGPAPTALNPPINLCMLEELFLSGNSVSLVAHMPGVVPNQLFGWRRQAASGLSDP